MRFFWMFLFVVYSVSHCSNKPTIKIIDWSFLCQWANIQNQQGIKYFFFPTVYQYIGLKCGECTVDGYNCTVFLNHNSQCDTEFCKSRCMCVLVSHMFTGSYGHSEIKYSWDEMEASFYCPISLIPFSFSVQAVYLSSPGMSMSRWEEAVKQRNTQCGNYPFTQVNLCLLLFKAT